MADAVGNKPVVFSIDNDAQKLWGEFYAIFGDGEEWNRIDTYGFRWMAIQTLLNGERSVTKAVVQDVIELMQYEVAVRQLVAPVIADNSEAEMEELIRRRMQKAKTLSRRQLQRDTNASRKGIGVFNKAMANMLNEGELIQSTGPRNQVIYTWVQAEEETATEPVIHERDDTSGTASPRINNGFSPVLGTVIMSSCATQ